MTEEEAELEAAKRERNKGKALCHMSWLACYNEAKGWHVALVENGRTADGIATAMNILSSRGYKEKMR